MAEDWGKWSGKIVQGKFRLQQYLGGSDRTAVFLTSSAQQQDAKAAIKLVLAKPANANLQLSRWKEAAALSHPHLLRIIDSGRCEMEGVQLLYVVTEYAEENLAQILPERALTADETRDLALTVLDTLGYLHRAGFVHGRLSPSNLLVAKDSLKLSSDGIVKMNELSGRTQRTAYDTPEAASMTTSAAGDIWSLGMVLAQALTQKLPTVKVGAAGNGNTSDPEIPASIPEPFQEIIRNCLRTDPQRRWTVDRIASRLQAASDDETSESDSARPKLSAKRRRVVVAAAVAAIAAAAGIMIHNQHDSSRSSAEQSAPSTQQSSADQPAQSGSMAPSASAQIDTPVDKKQNSAPAPAANPPAAVENTVAKRELRAVKSPAGEAPPQGVLHEVIPAVPLSARNTITGKVRVQVRVEVGASGEVTAVNFISAGPSKYFARLAHDAAQQWQFAPAQVNGQNTSSAWTLKFAFGREGTQVSPAHAD